LNPFINQLKTIIIIIITSDENYTDTGILITTSDIRKPLHDTTENTKLQLTKLLRVTKQHQHIKKQQP